ncbi:MAG: transketolase C-terminal domain-containing protein [Acidobacteriota bacterium]
MRKTSRVVVAHEDMMTMGFGAEIAARIAQSCFAFLDAPVVRAAARDSFVPAAPNLELAVLPSVQDLRAGVEQVLRSSPRTSHLLWESQRTFPAGWSLADPESRSTRAIRTMAYLLASQRSAAAPDFQQAMAADSRFAIAFVLKAVVSF